jgi:O-antigen/teichoic acid export membrane protein
LWAIQAIHTASAMASLLFSAILIYKRLDLRFPGWRDLRGCVNEAAPLFLFRMTATVQPVINPLLLAPFISAGALGNYAGAEKVSRFGSGLLLPLSEAIYPYMRRRETLSLNSQWSVLWANVVLGALLSTALFVTAPWITLLLLGPEFTEAPRILRLFSLLPLLVGIINALGVQWMIPAGMTRQYNLITGGTFALHVLLGILFSIFYGSLGMAAAVLMSSVGAIVAMSFALWRNYRRGPVALTELSSDR